MTSTSAVSAGAPGTLGRGPAGTSGNGRRPAGVVVRALVALTKPRIIELLLPGCEFIGVRGDKLHSVDGYF